MRCFAILLLAQALAGAPSLEERINALIDSSPGARGAFWGIRVVRVDSREVLYGKNPDRFFIPASNTKLFTTALALERLGPEYRFRTVVVGPPPGSDGIVHGDLTLVGGGDPTMSGREYPYRTDARAGDPMRAIEELAEQVAARGVKLIAGDIAGDDTAYVWEPYPEGWAQDDGLWEYGAPVSALTFNDNAMTLRVRPGPEVGDPAQLRLTPDTGYFAIDNRVATAAAGERNVRIDRTPGSRQLRVWGAMPAKDRGVSVLVAADDPALYAATALREALIHRGVAVLGKAVARHRSASDVLNMKGGGEARAPAPGVELARRESLPLAEILRVIDKVSQNLHAEIALREVGRARRNLGSRQAGLEEMRGFLQDADIAGSEYTLEDGSGLSRLNLVTPEAVTKLLLAMSRSARAEVWKSLLPVGGEDGTLSDRFKGMRDGSRVRAKTGTLSHVSALSGYVDSQSNGMLAFSILVNNYNAPSGEIRAIIDKICSVIAQ
jgi:D-alanyl-D-alanine carboxypeptidase/D-alanyl-D-alanine-endopeptidase (penicillin-binding protein 4)